MSNRQKIFIGLAVSAGVCSGVGLFLYMRHRRQIAISKTPGTSERPTSILSSLKSRRGNQYTDITTSGGVDHSNADSVRFQSGNATIEVDFPGGSSTLTPDQAIILTRYLDDNYLNNEEKFRSVLTTIANLATFAENQSNLTNAGCIERLRELLSSMDNEATQCKILLALNNLALNEESITHFSNIVSMVINLCRTSPSELSLRLYGLNLLVNMSVLEHLHDEFMTNIHELDLLIASARESNEEALAAGKLLVNLSTNKFNLKSLLKLTSVELKTIVNMCTPSKKSLGHGQADKLEEILLRYMTFYCNISETIVNELKHPSGDSILDKSWLTDPVPHGKGALYFELFDPEKEISAKSVLRPQYASNTINNQIKRLRQAMDTIRQIQSEASFSTVHDEFNNTDPISAFPDASTPKRSTGTLPIDQLDGVDPLADLEIAVNEQFDDDDDDTILPGQSSPSDQSLASYRSAYSTNENNVFTSPEKSISS